MPIFHAICNILELKPFISHAMHHLLKARTIHFACHLQHFGAGTLHFVCQFEICIYLQRFELKLGVSIWHPICKLLLVVGCCLLVVGPCLYCYSCCVVLVVVAVVLVVVATIVLVMVVSCCCCCCCCCCWWCS